MYNVWEKTRARSLSKYLLSKHLSTQKGDEEIGFTRDPITTIPRIGLTLALDTQIQTIESTDLRSTRQ